MSFVKKLAGETYKKGERIQRRYVLVDNLIKFKYDKGKRDEKTGYIIIKPIFKQAGKV